MPTTYRLKYLFRAEHRDGSMVFQTQDDRARSLLGSAYADVDHAQLKSFALEGSGIRVLLDLDTGAFTMNGVPLLDPEKLVSKVVTPLRLIYFRRVDQGLGELVGTPEREAGVSVTYHIGWQANDAEGNNVRRVLELD